MEVASFQQTSAGWNRDKERGGFGVGGICVDNNNRI